MKLVSFSLLLVLGTFAHSRDAASVRTAVTNSQTADDSLFVGNRPKPAKAAPHIDWLSAASTNFARAGMQQEGLLCNAVTINGYALTGALALDRRGTLAIGVGSSDLPNYKPIPFRVLIRRAGQVVGQYPLGDASTHSSVQLDDLLPHVQLGDELLIDPVRAADKGIKRTIRVKANSWAKEKEEDGC